MILQFDVSIFAMPSEPQVVDQIKLRGIAVSVLDARSLLNGDTFATSFDAALDRLAQLAGCDAEPDGYFLVAGGPASQRWQVDGHLYEYENRLWRVDLKGRCPRASFDELLSAAFASDAARVFQLVQEGVTLNAEDFIRWAGAEPERLTDPR